MKQTVPILILVSSLPLVPLVSGAAMACEDNIYSVPPTHVEQYYAVVGEFSAILNFPRIPPFCLSNSNTFVSTAPPCPPPTVSPTSLPGELCGLSIRPGGTIRCEWFPGPGSTSEWLHIGLDYGPAGLPDGNVVGLTTAAGEEVAVGGLAPYTPALITNDHWMPAHWIAYPLLRPIDPAGGIPGALNYVNCVEP